MSVTRADLLRAQSFLRRRMLAAVAFGSPDVTGRAVPPMRSVVVGIALSALLLAGSFAFGRLTGRPPPGWLDDDTLLRERGTGRLFLVSHAPGRPARLTPVPNRVSAQLISGTADLRSVEAAPRWVRTVPTDAAAGVVAAPDAPHWATVRRWTACVTQEHTGKGGMRLDTSDAGSAHNAAPLGAAVRDPDGALWLVASAAGSAAQRFRVEESHRRIVDLLALSTSTVPQQWLALFEEGPPITSSPLPGAGTVSQQVPGRRVGDVLATGQGFVLVTAEGPEPISPFTATVHEARTGRPAMLTEGTPPGIGAAAAGRGPWPDTFPPPATAVCAQLEASTGDVALVDHPRARPAKPVALRAALETGWLLRHGATPDEVGALDQAAGTTAPGGDTASTDTVVLVDEFGTCYPVLGEGTAEALGLRPGELPIVSQAWLDIVPTCHVLSRDRVRSRGP